MLVSCIKKSFQCQKLAWALVSDKLVQCMAHLTPVLVHHQLVSVTTDTNIIGPHSFHSLFINGDSIQSLIPPANLALVQTEANLKQIRPISQTQRLVPDRPYKYHTLPLNPPHYHTLLSSSLATLSMISLIRPLHGIVSLASVVASLNQNLRGLKRNLVVPPCTVVLT